MKQIINQDHECNVPDCGKPLVWIDYVNGADYWECVNGHGHLTGDCCDTVGDEFEEDEGILSERTARKARGQIGWT